MKKKAIEAIPPIRPVTDKKKAYLAIARECEIAGEKHMLLDVWNKEPDSELKFVMRAAYTAHDWALWWPDRQQWSRASIEDNLHKAVPKYDMYDMINGPGLPKEASWWNTAVDPESIEVMNAFYTGMKPNYHRYVPYREWWRNLEGIEAEIRSEKEEKEELSRRKRVDERCRFVPEIPEDFYEWADQEIFQKKEFVYYKRHGRYADCQCSRCGAQYTICNKQLSSYEGQFEQVYRTPVSGGMTSCLKCGALAMYKPKGRMKYTYGEKNYSYLIQRYKDTGTIVRYFCMKKEWSLGGKSKVISVEWARTYFDIFRDTKTDWHLNDGFSGKDRWYDHNVGGMGNISQREGAVYSANSDEWTSRSLIYSGLPDYIRQSGCWMKPTFYIRAASGFKVEAMIKIGLKNLTSELVGGNEHLFRRGRFCSIEDTLRIRRCRLSMIRQADNVDLLKVLQLERKNVEDIMDGEARGKGEWTEEQIDKALALRLYGREFGKMLRYMTITQLLNRVEKYLGREIIPDSRIRDGFFPYAHGDSAAKEIVFLYRDYLNLREENGLDMERSTSLYPRDLREAHRNVIAMIHAEQNDKRVSEYEKRFPNVKRKSRALKAKYGYKNDGLFVRPAKNIREIIEEGQILHHCVGSSDIYIKRHNEGTSAILFLRRITQPNEPYITIEIAGTEIRQWFGRNDTKPDRKMIEQWLTGWLEHLEAKEGKKAPTEALTEAG